MAKKKSRKVSKKIDLGKAEPVTTEIREPTKEEQGSIDKITNPKQIRLENRIPKRNVFLADSFRNERDAKVLNKEIGKREHKGKIKCITTIKHMEVTESGDWLTEFIIEMKND